VSPGPVQRPATRRQVLLAGAVGVAGGLLAAPAAATAASSGSSASAAPLSDGELLTRVLSTCQLAAYVYQQVFAEGVLTGSRRRAINGFDDQELAHVAQLRGAVIAAGGTVVGPPPSTTVANRDLAHRKIPGRLGHLRGPEDALDLLIDVERQTIGSCYVALLSLTGPNSISLVVRIMANDAQHEALVALQRHAVKLAAAAPYGLVSGSH
jgi:Ferritin-like domain